MKHFIKAPRELRCIATGCKRKKTARELCKLHYQHLYRYGDVEHKGKRELGNVQFAIKARKARALAKKNASNDIKEAYGFGVLIDKRGKID